MDKYEYKIRSDEIKSLIEEKAYVQAAEIADTIDWRRVKSVRMLCMVSDLYKVNRRFEDAKNMLLLAYDRRPGGKSICYSLCEICIKTGEFVQALKYCEEFVKAAPKDSGRYILKYKLYEAQEVSLEERIGVLEELKKRDYREKWAYELAYLYHRVGLATRCVEECDELILWFGDGKYVIKAMELKMLHQPLTPSQQAAYDRRFDQYETESVSDAEAAEEDTYEDQAVYDESEGYYAQGEESYPYEIYEEGEPFYGQEQQEGGFEPEEPEIQVKTMDVGKYNTINLQEELAAGLQEVLGAEEAAAEDMQSGSLGEYCGDGIGEDGQETEETEVFFGETGEIEGLESAEPGALFPEGEQPVDSGLGEEKAPGSMPEVQGPKEPMGKETTPQRDAAPQKDLPEPAEALAREAGGQIGLVLSGEAAVEKQITGQMNIEDILGEWERTKKESEEKRREEVRQRVLRQTGPMFTEFEAAVRDDLLEQLEGSTPEGAGTEPKGVGSTGGDGKRADTAGTAEPEGVAFGDQEAPQAVEDEYVQPARRQEETAWEMPVYAGEAAVSEEDFHEAAEAVFEEDASAAWAYADTEGYIDGAEDPAEAEEVYAGEYTADWAYEEDGQYGEEREGDQVIGEEVSQEFSVYGEDGEEADWEYAEEPAYEETFSELSEEEVYGEPEIYEADGEGSGDWEYAEEAVYEEEFSEISQEEIYEDPETYAEEGDGPVDWDFEEGMEEEADLQAPEGDEPENMEIPGEAEQSEAWDAEAGTSEALDYMEALEQLEDMEDGGAEQEAPKDQSGEAKEQGEAFERAEDPAELSDPVPEHDRARVRSLSREEKELFAPFIQSRQSREQLVKALDNISMAAYTGNVIITGEEGMDTLTLARNMIREVSMTDRNFSGRVAKISGQGLNQKDVRETLDQLHNGALIIQKASGMNSRTAAMLHMALQQEKFGMIVILEDTKKAIQKLFLGTPELFGDFTARMDLEALSNDVLVSFGRRYAREKEYSIDDLGVLALHTRIEECQTIDHVVTVIEVKQIVDEAIRHASRKTLGHFLDILLARRYDDEDMIILTEKDFVA